MLLICSTVALGTTALGMGHGRSVTRTPTNSVLARHARLVLELVLLLNGHVLGYEPQKGGRAQGVHVAFIHPILRRCHRFRLIRFRLMRLLFHLASLQKKVVLQSRHWAYHQGG